MDILDILLDILLKPPQPFIGIFFRFMTKSGSQFELLNWLEKSTRLLMLEDYDIVHFTIR